MDKVSQWIIKIGDWEYDREKPKRKYIDVDHIANMLIEVYGVDIEHIEPYTELLTFAFVNDTDGVDINNLNVDDVKKYITINGGINKIIESYKLK